MTAFATTESLSEKDRFAIEDLAAELFVSAQKGGKDLKGTVQFVSTELEEFGFIFSAGYIVCMVRDSRVRRGLPKLVWGTPQTSYHP